MTQVSGLSLKTFPLFIKTRFGDEAFEKWKAALDGEAKKVFVNPLIHLDDWYDFKTFFIEPMQLVCDMFYEGDSQSAWEMGRFSAEYALKGVLKVFVKMGTTLFLMNRAAGIVNKYYQPMDMRVIKNGKNYAILAIMDFPDYHILLEKRICGWVERALEISGCGNIQIHILKPYQEPERRAEIKFQWQ